MLFEEKTYNSPNVFTRPTIDFDVDYLRENLKVRSEADRGVREDGEIRSEIEISVKISPAELELFEKINPRNAYGETLGFPHGRSRLKILFNEDRNALIFRRRFSFQIKYSGCKTEKSRLAKWEKEFARVTSIEKEVARQDEWVSIFVGAFVDQVGYYNERQEKELLSKLGTESGWGFGGELGYTENETQAIEQLEQNAKKLEEELEQIKNNQNAIRNRVSLRRQKSLAKRIADEEPGDLPESVTGKLYQDLQNGNAWEKHVEEDERFFM